MGGFPRVLLSWVRGTSRQEFVRAGLSDPTSALVVIGERMLAADFPEPETARAALEGVDTVSGPSARWAIGVG